MKYLNHPINKKNVAKKTLRAITVFKKKRGGVRRGMIMIADSMVLFLKPSLRISVMSHCPWDITDITASLGYHWYHSVLGILLISLWPRDITHITVTCGYFCYNSVFGTSLISLCTVDITFINLSWGLRWYHSGLGTSLMLLWPGDIIDMKDIIAQRLWHTQQHNKLGNFDGSILNPAPTPMTWICW